MFLNPYADNEVGGNFPAGWVFGFFLQNKWNVMYVFCDIVTE